MYKLQPTESLPSGLKRIAEEQLTGAIQQLLDQRDIDQSIYQARRYLKRTRSVLRLLHAPLGPIYIEENRRLRDVARRFSALRDTHVALELLEKFAVQYKRKSTLNRQRQALAARQCELRQLQDCAQSIDELNRIRKRIDEWPLQDLSRALLNAEMRKTHKHSRQALATALQTRSAEDLHELRKSVKRELNQARLLEADFPVDHLKHLSDLLGDHHNLAVMLVNIECPSLRFQAMVQRQLRRLEAGIEEVGSQIYAPSRRAAVA